VALDPTGGVTLVVVVGMCGGGVVCGGGGIVPFGRGLNAVGAPPCCATAAGVNAVADADAAAGAPGVARRCGFTTFGAATAAATGKTIFGTAPTAGAALSSHFGRGTKARSAAIVGGSSSRVRAFVVLPATTRNAPPRF
jgi:hypothetical protein